MRNSLFIISPVLLLAVGATVYVLTHPYETRSQSVDTENLDAIAVSAPTPPTPFIYGNGDPNDPFEGDQFYGKANSFGILKSIADALPSHMDDFVYIQSLIPEREQYIASNANYINNPSLVWQTLICDYSVIDGQQRILVSNSLGKDINIYGGIGVHEEYDVGEIWQLVPNGNPIMLDRTLEFFHGLQTHAEAPIPDDSEYNDGGWMGPPIGTNPWEQVDGGAQP